MTAEQWPKVSALLDQLLDLAEPERGQFLAKLRAEDPALCAQVESLVQSRSWDSRFEAPPRSLLDAITTEERAEPTVPQQLGGYRIVKVLGGGGMGLVYEAEDPALRRRVACKVMKPEYAVQAQARARFLREAQAAAALHHDHIMPIYHVGDADGVAFLVMPLLEGETLEDRLRRTPHLTLAQILTIGRQIAEGLAAAHARGLIHRDIKPANIWLEAGRERVKLMDFGLARSLTVDAQLTQSGVILGTPAYMSPEQGRGDEVDARGDLFSLGCVLYRLCTGAPPFLRKDALSTIIAAAQETPPSPSERNQQIPAPVSALILKLLAKSPTDRYQSAAEVADRLQALTGAQVEPEAPTAKVSIQWRARLPRWVLGVVTAAALLAVLAALAYTFSTTPEQVEHQQPTVKTTTTTTTTRAAEPALLPIKEWLARKDRTQILTVAQDGSGTYKTLGAALAAVKAGQVIQVLDRGPYREELNLALPENVGLVSAIGTRIELPRWQQSRPLVSGFFYTGASLTAARGLRLHGFDIVAPELPADSSYAALLMLVLRGEVVVEACRLLHSAPFPQTFAEAAALPASLFTALHVESSPEKDTSLWVRHNLLQGALVMSSATQAPQACVIEENQLISWRYGGILLDSRSPGDLTVRHNVILCGQGAVGVTASRQNTRHRLVITNNLLEQQEHPLAVGPYDAEQVKLRAAQLIPANVRFQNNIVRSQRQYGIGLLPEAQELARKEWQLGHNWFTARPSSLHDLPMHATDLVGPLAFLADAPTNPLSFKRIGADSPLATAGAGADLPVYIGPFAPGPAPAGGDWFTRLLPVAESSRGREQ